MTQVTARPSTDDYRARRAAQLLAAHRENQRRDAAIAEVAPGATAAERAAVLEAWREDAEPVRTASGTSTGRRRPSLSWPRRLRRGSNQHIDTTTPDSATPDSATPDSATPDSATPRNATRAKPGRPATEPAELPAALATIPRPGQPTRGVGRIRSLLTRVVLIAAPLILVGGVSYSCGVSTGSTRLITPGVITADVAAEYHLTSFPADRVAAFATSYVTLCLTHPDPADSAAVANRLAGLAGLTSAGVTVGCGWTGSKPGAPPLAVTWNGTAVPINGYDDGAAAQLGFTVTAADGRTFGVTVPAWVSSTSTAQSMRIIGDLAVVPAAVANPAPPAPAAAITDSSLAGGLTTSVLLPFLRAWSASDPVQLGLVLAPDATGIPRAGLNGQLTDPTIADVQVVVVTGDPRGYRDGDRITARVRVDWTTGASTQRTGYSIGLQRVAGRWQVQAVAGAAPDPAGGAAPVTAATATASPAG